MRRQLFQPPTPVLFAGDDIFICLHEDGAMYETPAIQLRRDELHR